MTDISLRMAGDDSGGHLLPNGSLIVTPREWDEDTCRAFFVASFDAWGRYILDKAKGNA